MGRYKLICIIIGSLLCSSALASEPYVTGSYQQISQGYYVCFTLHNPLGDKLLWTFSVATSDASNPVSPTGWSIYQTFREVNWETRNLAQMVQPHSSSGGFAFISQSLPGSMGWSVHGSPSGDYRGSVTPAPVPEPCSLLVLGMGGLGVLGAALRRRVRTQM